MEKICPHYATCSGVQSLSATTRTGHSELSKIDDGIGVIYEENNCYKCKVADLVKKECAYLDELTALKR